MILVAGLINIETTLKIDRFPFEYTPVRYPFFGVNSTVSGVGYNVAKALTTLGNDVRFLSLIGDDPAGQLVMGELAHLGIDTAHILPQMAHTPQSVILYDPDGKRAINTDLKDIQEQVYPPVDFAGVALAVLCNVNFSRPLLAGAKAAGIPIATDIHAISNIRDEYNQDYMAHANILFQSHEHLPVQPEQWIRLVWEHYNTPIVVVGMGGEGALLGVRDDGRILHVPAVKTRPIISTIGAGDALFSAFVHGYVHTHDPVVALRQAVVFASYKIGVAGAADGFLSAGELSAMLERV